MKYPKELGEKDLFISAYSSTSQSIKESQGRSSGRNLKAGTKSKAMKEHYLPAGSSRLTQPDFLYYPGPPIRDSTPHSGPSPSTSLTKKHTTDLSMDKSYEDIFSIESTTTNSAFCQVDIKAASTSGFGEQAMV